MKYFTFMINLVSLTVVALLLRIIHKFAGMFEELGVALPQLSRWIVQSHGVFPLLIVVALAIAAMISAFLQNQQKALWLTISAVVSMLLCAGLVIMLLYIPLMEVISQM